MSLQKFKMDTLLQKQESEVGDVQEKKDKEDIEEKKVVKKSSRKISKNKK